MGNKKNNVAVLVAAIIVVLLAIGVLAYVLTLDKPTQPRNSTPQKSSTFSEPTSESDDQSPAATTDQADSKTVITFTDEGFNPTSYTTTKGSTVTVKNESSMELQFSSDNHPAHTEQSELNMSSLRPGQSGTFTVTKTGTFGFHDHINDQFTGTLTVE